ncbi:acyl-CoA dehydrogenase [Pseudohyphozyma bogoriensis]|nr:acyl-CoA dehydrogenase [Pseudohyphozyma bogoriensis]
MADSQINASNWGVRWHIEFRVTGSTFSIPRALIVAATTPQTIWFSGMETPPSIAIESYVAQLHSLANQAPNNPASHHHFYQQYSVGKDVSILTFSSMHLNKSLGKSAYQVQRRTTAAWSRLKPNAYLLNLADSFGGMSLKSLGRAAFQVQRRTTKA